MLCFSQVNHNGHLTFQAPWFSYIPQRFPMRGTRDIIAPFWTDLNNVVSGDIYYAQHTSGQLLHQVTRDINEYFPELNFNAELVFIATWDEVAYYSGPGTVSDFDLTAGYDTVNSHHYFTIPGSFSGSSSVFSQNSNVNKPGRWVFRVDLGSSGPLYPISGIASSQSDDGSSPRLTLQRPFVYFGRTYNNIYVLQIHYKNLKH
uniref:NIDO domain-containing protein n=1 Tax=Kryptolebias marmoratus TaxID=37003 RepID=A0A3Q3BF40_KRYMA